ncbi:MAG: heavy metal translocating P-type ATPase [Deltaproteobacteria bacterium]|nr:heavy metal translocating P-type ATPase [Deltaproteobacteria bacterium]
MAISAQQKQNSSFVACSHCGNEVPLSLQKEAGLLSFCCKGCETVYQILHSNGFDLYYQLKKSSRWIRRALPVSKSNEDYQYLDDSEFLKNNSSNKSQCLDFYLEGVHCAACLWLVEKLPEMIPDVEQARLDMGKSIAHIQIKPEGSFAKVAKMLDELGYRPHPITQNADQVQLQQKEQKQDLYRIGIAAACTGNIMLLAAALYSGLTGPLARLFSWVSLFLFLPVLFYSAWPFYRSSWASLKTKVLSIDVPIVLAIWVGTFASIGSLFQRKEVIYFDSLSALVLLLLSSRFFLKKIQQGVLNSSKLLSFFTSSKVIRKNLQKGLWEQVWSQEVKTGDTLRIQAGETFPVDGLILEGESTINLSLLTGEAMPAPVSKGDLVYAGTRNESNALEIQVESSAFESRLGKIIQQIESSALQKPAVVEFADKISKTFVSVVLAIAVLLVLYFISSQPVVGFERALALIIVTCPCVLAFATPLAISLSIQSAAKEGILIKSPEVIERLNQAHSIVLDKTGTLTEGQFKVLQWMEEVEVKAELASVIVALESRSRHPIARALVRHFEKLGPFGLPEIINFKEALGVGVSGFIRGHLWEIRALTPSYHRAMRFLSKPGTRIGVWKNNQLVAQGILGDEIRSEAKPCIDSLQKRGLTAYILSGDQESYVHSVAKALEIPEGRTMAQCSPELKKDLLKNFKNPVMVGDGANDSLALSSAFVGIAVHGSMEMSLKSADIYLSQAGLHSILQVFDLARRTQGIVYRNFAFSLFYNLLGGIGAILGWVNPLVAAVLMPLSAFTVFVSTLLGIRSLEKKIQRRAS